MNHRVLHSGPGGAAFNMALDEALLEAMPRLQISVLRLYGWTEPAASFGYFQKFSEVERATPLRPLIRRPTGGGIVPHAADWTYSLIFPAGHEWHSLKAEESYRRAHELVQRAFAELKIETGLASDCQRPLPGQCFAGHEKFDLLWRGKKIAGAAQRRNKWGLLIQGSVQPPPVPVSRTDWENAMAGGVEDFLPPPELLQRAEELARVKYSQWAYNAKR